MKYLLIASMLISASAYSNETNYNTEEVMWIGGSVGTITSNNNQIINQESTNLELKVGYDFNQNFALYGSYGLSREIIDNYLSVGAQANYHFNNKWSVYGSLGGGYYLDSDASNSLKPIWGVGGSYQITPRFSSQLGFNIRNNAPLGNRINDDVQELYWGITYHFNRPEHVKKIIQQIKIYE